MRLLKSQVFVDDKLEHEQQVPFRMMLFVSHEGIGLGLGDLLVLLGFPDKLRKRCGIANSRWHLYLLELFKSFFVKPLQNLFPGGALYDIHRNPCGRDVAVCQAPSSCSRLMPCRPASSSRI